MTFPNPGPNTQTTGNVAGGPYGAWSGTGTTALIGPAGLLVPIGGVGGGVALAAGANSITSGTAVLSNGNGVTFGINGQTITASASGGGLALYDGTNSISTGTGQFSNANGVSFGFNGQTITASVAAQGGAQTGISSIADGAGTQTVGMLSFSNKNGVTFGLSTGALTATLTASVSQSVQTQTAGNIAQTGFATTTTNGVVIVGTNQGGVTLAVPPYITTYAAQTVQPAITAIADNAGTQTTGVLSFSNLNGMTFGLSTGAATATLTASYTVPATAGLISGMRLSAGAGTSNTAVSGLTFANSNGITFGLSTGANVGTITASYTVPTQTAQTLSAIVSSNTVGNTSAMTFDARSMSLQGYGMVSVGFLTNATGSTIQFSGTTTSTNPAFSAQGGSSSFQTLVFTNSNNVSFSNTGGSVWGSFALNVSATGGTSNALSGLTFKDSNNISFGLSTGAGVGTITATVASQVTSANWFALGNTTQNSSSAIALSAISLNGLGAQTVGYSNGSIQLSVPATSSLVGTTGLSVSTNGSTISVFPIVFSTYVPQWPASTSSVVFGTLGSGSCNPVFFPFQVLWPVSFNIVRLLESNSVITAATTNGQTQSVAFGLYSNNASTWSVISSSSSSILFSGSGASGTVSYATATSTSGYGYATTTYTTTAQAQSLFGTVGLRQAGMQFGGNMTLTPGWYAVGLVSIHTSATSSMGIVQALGGNVVAVSNLFGLGQSTTVTNAMMGMGYGTAATGALPSSMAFSNMTNSLGIIPIITLAST